MKIGFYTHYNEAFKVIADLTVPTMQKYCYKQAYKFEALTTSNCDRHIVWHKIKLLLENLNKYDYLCYCDADAIITNSNIKLEDFVNESPDKHLFICNDINGLNSGAFIIKNSWETKEFFTKVWNIAQNHPIYDYICHWSTTQAEQKAMIATIGENHNEFQKHIHYIKQNKFNSYQYSLYNLNYPDGEWNENSLLLHLPGCKNEQRVQIFKEYLTKIK
jgi:hypothetical protein